MQSTAKYGKYLNKILKVNLEERIKQLADKVTAANLKNSQLQEHIEYLNKQLNDNATLVRNSKSDDCPDQSLYFT